MNLASHPISLNLLLLLLTLNLIITASGLNSQHSNHQLHSNEEPAGGERENSLGIFLESMEDLEHISYLSMRNFNMTDERLLQSSWLMGLGNVLHKQQHHLMASLTQSSSSSDIRQRLSLMLETFISHLRNGHLRRLTLSELETVSNNLEPLKQQDSAGPPNSGNRKQDEANSSASLRPTVEPNSKLIAKAEKNNGSSNARQELRADKDRCHYLVTVYKHELMERQKSLAGLQAQQQVSPALNASNANPAAGEFAAEPVDTARLMGLCELVVRCNTAEELVGLIGGTWRRAVAGSLPAPAKDQASRKRRQEALARAQKMPNEEVEFISSSYQEKTGKGVPRTLRDSLSLSLAKLCPLILFQLHEEDGFCSVRREDRPAMVTVWAFATLFVTIVCFCSLIGLSITPLLGPTTTASASSSSSDGSHNSSRDQLTGPSSSSSHLEGPEAQARRLAESGRRRGHPQQETPNHSQKACLTLFEGLAVGSLVGSALFSLIPQAFELQERESNQGFLLKALIIFFGIYLFFCSERIMRIILDARQRRKKQKRINHLSSNSIALPSTTVDCSQRGYLQVEEQPLEMYAGGVGRRRKVGANRSVSMSTSGQAQSFNSKLSERRRSARAVNFEGSPENSLAEIEDESLSEASNQKLPREGEAEKREASERSRRQRRRRRRSRQELRKHRLRRSRHQQPSLALRPAGNDDSDDELKRARSPSSSSSSSLSLSSPPHNQNPPVSGKRRSKVEEELEVENFLDSSQLDESNAYASNDDHHYSSRGNQRGSPPGSGWSDGEEHEQQIQQMRAVSEHMNQQLSKCRMVDESLQSPSQRRRRNQRANRQPPAKKADQTMRLDSRGPHSARSSSFRFRAETTNSSPRANSRLTSDSLRLTEHHERQQAVVKRDISTVAWMIVLGDGLHNFIDGISIGAAFSESILSGVSISVAVICEEFPHELGDFAVLVSAGMTVRQALGYNFLSACTCYLGMAVGIILGDVNDGASYISALAAGVFLYIALVDMMGELSATLEETSRDSITRTLKFLLLQNIGIFIGISIIFILSFIDF